MFLYCFLRVLFSVIKMLKQKDSHSSTLHPAPHPLCSFSDLPAPPGGRRARHRPRVLRLHQSQMLLIRVINEGDILLWVRLCG